MAVKELSAAVLLDHHEGHGFDRLVCSKAAAAARALTAAADAVTLLDVTAVKHVAVGASAVGTFHLDTVLSCARERERMGMTLYYVLYIIA